MKVKSKDEETRRNAERIRKAGDFTEKALDSFTQSIEYFHGLTDFICLIRIMKLEVLCYRHEITPGIYDDEWDMQNLIKDIRNELKLIDA
jgi:hypothetical protein